MELAIRKILDNNGKFYHVYGNNNKPLYSERYDDAWQYSEDGVTQVKLDDRWFHIDITGKPLYTERYDRITYYKNGIAKVKLDGKWFHIDMQGNPLYSERYDEIHAYGKDGIARVKSDDKWFHIDMTGNPLYNELYDEVRRFNNGIAKVKLDGKWFHIDMVGKPLYPERYNAVYRYNSEGIARVKSDGVTLLITTNGTILSSIETITIGNRKINIYLYNNRYYVYNGCDIMRLKRFKKSLKYNNAFNRNAWIDVVQKYRRLELSLMYE